MLIRKKLFDVRFGNCSTPILRYLDSADYKDAIDCHSPSRSFSEDVYSPLNLKKKQKSKMYLEHLELLRHW